MRIKRPTLKVLSLPKGLNVPFLFDSFIKGLTEGPVVIPNKEGWFKQANKSWYQVENNGVLRCFFSKDTWLFDYKLEQWNYAPLSNTEYLALKSFLVCRRDTYIEKIYAKHLGWLDRKRANREMRLYIRCAMRKIRK